MGNKIYTRFLCLIALAFFAVVSSCQKDPAVAGPSHTSSDANADSAISSLSGNSLAASGTLRIKFKDSIYTFDAAHDSIAFINVNGEDQNRYFGITAINKAHTVSFGISSAGFAFSNINRGVAGSQLLLNSDPLKPALQLSLRRDISPVDFGNVSLVQYKTGNELAKGTFYTFLSADEKPGSPYFRVEGSFDLKLK